MASPSPFIDTHYFFAYPDSANTVKVIRYRVKKDGNRVVVNSNRVALAYKKPGGTMMITTFLAGPGAALTPEEAIERVRREQQAIADRALALLAFIERTDPVLAEVVE